MGIRVPEFQSGESSYDLVYSIKIYGTTFFSFHSGWQPPPLAPPLLQKQVEGYIFLF